MGNWGFCSLLIGVMTPFLIGRGPHCRIHGNGTYIYRYIYHKFEGISNHGNLTDSSENHRALRGPHLPQSHPKLQEIAGLNRRPYLGDDSG